MPMLISAALAVLLLALPASAEDHRVLMLNAASEDSGHPNVFEPALLFIEPGDSVTFVPVDSSHNSASWRRMLPQGAEEWNGGIDEELTVTLTVPGVYGYICAPHYSMGMVGLIVVGDPSSNLQQARGARHRGTARTAFRELFARLDAELAAAAQ